MQKYEAEPGVLSILRLYIGCRAVLSTLQVIRFVFIKEDALDLVNSGLFIAITLFDTYFLLVYLFIPWISKKLGKFYIPIALAVITVGAMLESYWFSLQIMTFRVTSVSLILLFIPLVLIAWQYKFIYVFLFSLGTCTIEFLINVPWLANISDTDTAAEAAIMASLWIVIVVTRTFIFLLVGYMITRLVKAKQMQQEALKISNLELAHANMRLTQHAAMVEQLSTSQERNRLAREFHDTLAHTLSGLAVQLDAITTVWEPNPEKAKRMLLEALSVTRSGLDETRRALQDLRATALEEMGLAIAIRTLAEDAARRSALELLLDIPEQIPDLSPIMEQSFYRIAQEAIQNCLKHSQANRLSVTLKQENGRIKLEVADNGIGFDLSAPVAEQHFGLAGMCERAEIMGAVFNILSNPQTGTMITVILEKEHDTGSNL